MSSWDCPEYLVISVNLRVGDGWILDLTHAAGQELSPARYLNPVFNSGGTTTFVKLFLAKK